MSIGYFRKFITILGSTWTLYGSNCELDSKLGICSVYCDSTSRSIVVNELDEENSDIINVEEYIKRLIRRGIIHAFMIECGMAQDEQDFRRLDTGGMLHWFTVMGERIYKAWGEAGAVDKKGEE